jgi:hypothetical protein
LLLALASCGRGTTTQTKLEACDLISAEEIKAVQDSPLKETKPSERSESGFRVSQCVYITEDSSKTVVVTVWQRDPTDQTQRSPRDFWKERFDPYRGVKHEGEQGEAEKTSEPQPGEESERKTTTPLTIEHLGDEAYWIGGLSRGLYVLKKDVFIRIGAGGQIAEDLRIKNSKLLARKALERL